MGYDVYLIVEKLEAWAAESGQYECVLESCLNRPSELRSELDTFSYAYSCSPGSSDARLLNKTLSYEAKAKVMVRPYTGADPIVKDVLSESKTGETQELITVSSYDGIPYILPPIGITDSDEPIVSPSIMGVYTATLQDLIKLHTTCLKSNPLLDMPLLDYTIDLMRHLESVGGCITRAVFYVM